MMMYAHKAYSLVETPDGIDRFARPCYCTIGHDHDG